MREAIADTRSNIMPETRENLPIAVSNTGPLISIFQSNSLDLVVALFGRIHTSKACEVELMRHDWGDALARAGPAIISHKLTSSESAQAKEFAKRIAVHPTSKDTEPDNHLGEAEVMVLVQRPEFAGSLLLLDELAARAVAAELNLSVSGFAGVLLLAVDEGLLTADEVKERLERCQQQGIHYSITFIHIPLLFFLIKLFLLGKEKVWFIERIYQTAKEGEK
jgi:predicted nucleic acid-binding protein